MAPETEEIVEGAMDRKKTLCLPWGFEPAHLAFPVARRLMRDFHSVVSPTVLAVADAGQELSASSAITAQPIGHKQAGNVVQAFQQLAKEAFGRALIPVLLDENIKHITVLVHSTPEVVTLPLNRDKDFVEMRRITESPLAMPQLLGKGRTEFQAPLTDGLVTDRHPAVSQ
jgi:hypothetical protein